MLSLQALSKKYFGVIIFFALGISYIPLTFYFGNAEVFSYDYNLLMPPIVVSLVVVALALPDAQDHKYTIRFEIDKPTTPKSVGVNNDTRELGFGFIDMRLLSDEVTT